MTCISSTRLIAADYLLIIIIIKLCQLLEVIYSFLHIMHQQFKRSECYSSDCLIHWLIKGTHLILRSYTTGLDSHYVMQVKQTTMYFDPAVHILSETLLLFMSYKSAPGGLCGLCPRKYEFFFHYAAHYSYEFSYGIFTESQSFPCIVMGIHYGLFNIHLVACKMHGLLCLQTSLRVAIPARHECSIRIHAALMLIHCSSRMKLETWIVYK